MGAGRPSPDGAGGNVGVVAATRRYEAWMAGRLPVVRPDLAAKHRAMADSAFAFLRGTFYRFTERVPELCPEIADAPSVLAVGDLHIENFGTWRDLEGRLVWGVNDVDEAHALPYAHDLVRLATSARLAISENGLGLSPRGACDLILAGYEEGLRSGGRALVLEEHDRWLRRIALGRLREPRRFWRTLDELTDAEHPVPASVERAFAASLPPCDQPYRVVHRRAGVGSLGRPRYVAIGLWHGSRVARECKALLPSACVLAEASRRARSEYLPILGRAVRCPDPTVDVLDGWIVRRLSPECSRIELPDLAGVDEDRLMRSMGWETANIHLGTRGAAAPILTDLDRRPAGWLRLASRVMAQSTLQDHGEWTAARAIWEAWDADSEPRGRRKRPGN